MALPAGEPAPGGPPLSGLPSGGPPSGDSHRALRTALGRFATGVAVVTTVTPAGRPVGLTVNSFSSVSLDPPLVLWCLRRSSASLPAFLTADRFAVNLLAARQRHLAARFAAPVPDRFAGVPWQPDRHRLPLLSGTIAYFACRRARLLDAGDHLLLIGQVEDHATAPGEPLIFLDGGYARR